jgi:predicted GNAT family acetyltransferase
MYYNLPYLSSIALGFLLVVVVLFVIIFIYIKLRFKFWSIQPVFHVYDFRYYLFPPGIIDASFPEKNRYCNFINIETVEHQSVSENKIGEIIHFIQLHYLRNGENQFLPKKENFVPYFVGHRGPSFFTFYYQDELLMDSVAKETITRKRLVSFMTSRPLHVSINNGHKNATFDVYYVDYLCVDEAFRKKGIAQQMIQTHEYNQRRGNKNVVVSLFKREDELTGIVPLCVYKTVGFSMEGWNRPTDLEGEYSVVECGPTNMHFLVDFLRETQGQFDICIMPEITGIAELVKTGNVFIWMLIQSLNVCGVYFFRRNCTKTAKESEVLSLFSSIREKKTAVDVFIHGYKVALSKICEKHAEFRVSVLENIADNEVIIDNLKKKTTPIVESPTAYFFYNFAYGTFRPQKVLILN